MNRKQKAAWLAMIFPSAAGFLCFSLLPTVYSLILSFFEGGRLEKFAGISNYLVLFQSESFQLAVWNTLRFILVAVPVSMTLALVFALWLERSPVLSQLFQSVLFFPFVIPSICIAVVFGEIFALDGWLNRLFRQSVDYLGSGWAFVIAIIVFLWKNTGILLLLLLQGLHTIPPERYDAFRLDSDSAIDRFRMITFPGLRPSLGFALFFAILQVLRLFRDIYLIFGKYPPREIYMLQHFLNNAFFNLEYGKLTSCAFTVSVLVILLAAGLYFCFRRRWK